MTDHKLVTSKAVARVKFNQALLKCEPTVSIPSINTFCDDLEASFKQNTSANIQACTQWILENIANSKSLLIALGEYLVALSLSIRAEQDPTDAKAVRNRTDLVLLMNDVLHAGKFHGSFDDSDVDALVPYIQELLRLAASCLKEPGTRFEQKLKAIIKYWRINGFLDSESVNSIIAHTRDALRVAQGGAPSETVKRVQALPDYLGDKNAPWYHLPASSFVGMSVRSSHTRANYFRGLRAEKLDRRIPSTSTTKLLDEYMEKLDAPQMLRVDDLLSDTDKSKKWTDPMGLEVIQSSTNSEIVRYNGYGWDMTVCRDMTQDGVMKEMAQKRKESKAAPVNLDLSSQGFQEGRPRSRDQGRDFGQGRDFRSNRNYNQSAGRFNPGRGGFNPNHRNSQDYGQPHARSSAQHNGSSAYGSQAEQSRAQFTAPQSTSSSPGVPVVSGAGGARNGYGRPGYGGAMYGVSAPSDPSSPAPSGFGSGSHGAPNFGYGNSAPNNFGQGGYGQGAFGQGGFGQPGSYNANAYPNAYGQTSGAGYPSQFGDNSNVGYNAGYAGFQRGRGYQDFNARGGNRGNNQRGQGRGSQWN